MKAFTPVSRAEELFYCILFEGKNTEEMMGKVRMKDEHKVIRKLILMQPDFQDRHRGTHFQTYILCTGDGLYTSSNVLDRLCDFTSAPKGSPALG